MPSKTAEMNKRELLLSVNTFNKPTELIGKDAWARLVLNLLFMKKGTFPSMPDMGIGIQDYEYEFIDTAVASLNEEIEQQIRTYLPDLPLKGVKVSSTTVDRQEILLIAMTFDDHGTIDSSVVAAAVGKQGLIDFEISW